jgi:hypothetical protein
MGIYQARKRRAAGRSLSILFIAQKTSVATMEASHMHDKFDGLHDQSSSASRVTAGAFGFLTLIQQSLRPGR